MVNFYFIVTFHDPFSLYRLIMIKLFERINQREFHPIKKVSVINFIPGYISDLHRKSIQIFFVSPASCGEGEGCLGLCNLIDPILDLLDFETLHNC